MSNHDPIDTGRSLEPLDDEAAIEIMEGRLPAADRPETDEVALAIARGLLAEEAASSGGGTVVEFFARQPWMRMAAALVLGLAVATVMQPGMEPAEPAAGMASANVSYFETVRSSSAADVPTIAVGREPFVTLIAYPYFRGAERLSVRVDRAAVPDQSAAEAMRADRWVPVLETTTPAGATDTLVVNVAADALRGGLHRLRIATDSESEAEVHLFTIAR